MHSYEILPIVKYWSFCHVQLINVLYTCFIATFSITRKANINKHNKYDKCHKQLSRFQKLPFWGGVALECFCHILEKCSYKKIA